MIRKVCLIIGAGCTISDVTARPKKSRPPLDNRFFSVAITTNPRDVSKIAAYITNNYGLDILHPDNDSLEKVMAMIYTDVFDPHLRAQASSVFRTLVSLFNRRLAETTNNLRATQQRYLYRIITYYLKHGFRAEDITIITFNQDIQIEKVLYKLGQTKKYKKQSELFNFPYCYSVPVSQTSITVPSGAGEDIFDIGDELGSKGIMILKLHGSLNWYSTHKSMNPSPQAMFRADRVIRMTRRQIIEPNMTLSGKHRTQNTLPVIVPPVTHKSAILHNHIKPLWAKAEKKLKKAHAIVIFGYSCPTMDFESSNLIRRALMQNTHYQDLIVIDPDPTILTRYVNLIKPTEITYYPSAHSFLHKR